MEKLRGVRRRLVRIAWMATAAVGALVVGGGLASQTDWFRDWARRTVIRQSATYLNGELAIARLEGNIFTGIQLTKVALQQEGRSVIAAERVSLKYSLLTLIREGVVLQELTLDKPVLRVSQDATGWNVARLVKTRENTGQAPRPVTLERVQINDGDVSVQLASGRSHRVQDLDATLRLTSASERLDLHLDGLSAKVDPSGLAVRQLAGKLTLVGDDLSFEDFTVQTERSRLKTSLIVRDYETRPIFDARLSAERLSALELAPYVAALKDVLIEPSIRLAAKGPLDRLDLDMEITSPAGNAAARLVANLHDATRSAKGTLNLLTLDAGPFLGRPAGLTNVTGTASFDVQHAAGAPATALSGSIDLTAPDVAALGYRAQQIRAHGVARGGILTLNGQAAAYGAFVTVGQATLRLPSRSADGYRYAATGNVRNLDLRNLPASLRAPGVASRFAGRFDVSGDPGGFAGNVHLHRSTVAGAILAAGTTARVAMRNAILSYGARGRVSHLDLHALAGPLEIPTLVDDRFRSNLTASFDASGSGRTLDRLHAAATIDLDDSDVLGGHVPAMHLGLDLAQRRLAATIRGSFAGLAVPDNPLGIETMTGNADVRVTLKSLGAPMTPDGIEAQGRATLLPSVASGVPIDQIDVQGSYLNQVARLDRLDISGPAARLSALGIVGLDEETGSSLKYTFEGHDLSQIGARFETPVAGSATLEGTISGPRRRLTTTGTLKSSRLKYGDSFEALTLQSRYDATLPDLQLDQLALRADTQGTFLKVAGQEITQLTAKTTYEHQQLGFQGRIEQQQRALDVEGDLLLHPEHQELHLRQLTLGVDQARWSLAAGQEAIVQYRARRPGASASGRPEIKIDGLVLESGAQRIAANGTIALSSGEAQDETGIASARGDLNVRLEGIQLAEINRLMTPPGTRKIEGRLDASARLVGTIKDPTVKGDLRITNGVVEAVLFETFTTTVDYRDRQITVKADLQQSPTARLTAAGVVPATAFGLEAASPDRDRFDLRIESTPIDLGLVQGLSTHVADVKGSAQAHIQVTGPGRAPAINGTLEISKGSFRVPATGGIYTGLDARVRFDADHLTIEQFNILDDDLNPLRMEGGLGLTGRQVKDVDVHVSTQKFELLDNALGQFEIATDLRVRGDLSAPRVEGQITTLPGRLQIDELLGRFKSAYAPESTPPTTPAATADRAPAVAADPSAARAEADESNRGGSKTLLSPVSSPRPSQTPSAQVSPAGVFDAVLIDVHVIIPDNFVLRGRDIRTGNSSLSLGSANLTIGGDLQIKKSPGEQPRILGPVTVVRGFYDFQGRRFDVQRDSQLRFVGEWPVNPRLSVTAERVISGVTAIVHLQGTAQSPELTLSSTPPLDQADILSLIVFNQPANELGASERVSLGQRAGVLAAGYLAGPLAESVARALDVDLFEIRAAGPEGGGPEIALGQQINDRLYVSFRQEFGSADVSQVSFEYRFSEMLRLVTTVAQGAQRTHRTQRVEASALDLIFVFRR